MIFCKLFASTLKHFTSSDIVLLRYILPMTRKTFFFLLDRNSCIRMIITQKISNHSSKKRMLRISSYITWRVTSYKRSTSSKIL